MSHKILQSDTPAYIPKICESCGLEPHLLPDCPGRALSTAELNYVKKKVLTFISGSWIMEPELVKWTRSLSKGMKNGSRKGQEKRRVVSSLEP